MTKKMFFVLGLIAVLGISSAVVYGRGGHRGGGNHGGCNRSYDDSYGHNNGRNNRNYTSNMTTEEREKYDTLYEKYVPQMENIRSEITVQNSIIRAERVKSNPDIGKINAAIDAESKLSADLSKIRVEYSIEMDKLFPRNRNY